MQLSLIRTDARYMISPQITSTEYPDTDIDRNVNRWYRTVVGWAIAVNNDWEMAGDVIYRDFADSVTDYSIPVGLVRIYKGEVMYSTGGNYVPLHFNSIQANQETSEGNATRAIDDPSNPTADLFGDKIVIRPAQTTGSSIVNGIKLWVQLDLADLVDDTDSPDLMEHVQRAICIGAAMDYCKGEEMWNKYRELKKELLGDPAIPNDSGVKGLLESLYSIRTGAKRDQLRARRRSYR